MKRLYIIDDRRPLWREIALLLEEINAEIHIITGEEALQAFEGDRPDLLIVGEEARHLVPRSVRDLSRILVSGEVPPGEILRAREGRHIVRLGWPMDREALFELTSRILNVPERRPHQTPVLVLARGHEEAANGQSEDFSLTGMAFRTVSAFARNEEVTIAFGNGARGEGLRLEAAVVRSVPGRPGETILYGVRFLPLAPADRHSLERFVWHLRRRTG